MAGANRILAFLVMCALLFGLLGAPISYLFVGFGANPGIGLAIGAGIVVAVTIALGGSAPSARIAWGRLCVAAAVASFALPLEAFVGTIGVGAQAARISDASYERGVRGAEAIGTGIATIAMTGLAGLIGLFLGLIFLVIAYFTLRDAPRSAGG